MPLRHGFAATLLLGLLASAFALMLSDALRGHVWPGWDEGWVLVTFPLAIPAAVAAGLAASRGTGFPIRVASVTAAVWCWGAVVFLLWHVVG